MSWLFGENPVSSVIHINLIYLPHPIVEYNTTMWNSTIINITQKILGDPVMFIEAVLNL